ncbi:MAG: prepilin peptidase [Candidatus Omnitrophica bacterium]|nr:prepilin peptidase [Candidatus Omnitrophota bacterium]
MLELTQAIIIFLFAICIGSFLNVCIYRMGREQSIVMPASHCPSCKHPIRWYDNIPLLSYVFLRGRCRDCHAPISWRYFAVELLTGVLFLLLYDRFGLSAPFFIFAVLVSGLLVATFVDFDFQIIPDEISVGGIVAGFLASVAFPEIQGMAPHLLGLRESLLGIVVGGGTLWILGLAGDFIFKKESMGGGDIKLLAMVGSFLGWKAALLTLPVASLCGAVVGVIIKLRTKESVIAFGPYLSLAAIINIFWMDRILAFLFGL